MEIKEELNAYQRNKQAIYKWRDKNIEKYHIKQQEYNRICYMKNRENIIAKVRSYQNKKQLESGLEKRRVGRPSKIYHEIII